MIYHALNRASNYQYDAEQHPVSVDDGSAVSFTYNALGQRVQSLWPAFLQPDQFPLRSRWHLGRD